MEKNNWNQSLPVTVNEFLTPLYWDFGPLFFSKLLRSFRFEGCLLPTAVLRPLHMCSMGFRSGLIAGHIRTLQRFVCNHFWSVFQGHCPAGRPMTSGGDAAFWHWPLCCAPKLFGNHQFHDTVHTVKTFSTRSSKATPKHVWTTPMFDCRDCVLLFEDLISFL